MKKAMIWGMNEKSCLEKEATFLAQAFHFLRYGSLVCIFRFWVFFFCCAPSLLLPLCFTPPAQQFVFFCVSSTQNSQGKRNPNSNKENKHTDKRKG